jgi:hypothetical protein
LGEFFFEDHDFKTVRREDMVVTGESYVWQAWVRTGSFEDNARLPSEAAMND